MSAQLTCPGCGAAALPEASQCEYCRAALVKVACPSCFGALFDGMRFCPHCGTRAKREAAESGPTACPGCSTTMRRVQVGTAALDECPDCVSCWLPTDTFVAICTHHEDRGAIAALATGQPRAPQQGGATPIRYLPCPICRKLMNRMNFGRRSGVIVDVCSGHGVWFEHQELRRVLEFIDSGGLEKARAAEREKIREERRGLDQKLRDLAGERSRSGGNTGTPFLVDSDARSPLAEILSKLLT